MKLKLITVFLFIASFAFGQTYNSLISEANLLYNRKEYKESVSKFKEAFEIEQKKPNDLYNAACSASLSGNQEMAFKWLHLSLKNGWTNIDHLKTDEDLENLHATKEWKKLLDDAQKEVDKREESYDKTLQKELLEIFAEDQKYRQQLNEIQQKFGWESKEIQDLWTVIRKKDSLNLIKVESILDEKGWVGADKVGARANQTLFLVIQHSDLKTQQKYLPMMRDAVKKKNADGSSLALLEDRVRLGEGKKQIYGSQIGQDQETKTYYVLPLDDAYNVDKLRAEVGLQPLSEYVKNWNIIWNLNEYKKQLPEIEAKEKAKRK